MSNKLPSVRFSAAGKLGDLQMTRVLNLIRIFIPRKFSTVKIGGITFVGRNKRGFGIRGIALKGFEIEPELQFVKYYLRPGDTFIDVGANTGIYALHASAFVEPEGRVFAFEPNIEMAYSLSCAVKMNSFDNLIIVPIGVSEKQGISNFFHNFSKPNSYSLSKHDANATKETILTISLNDFFHNQDLGKLTYIKIDVEGDESKVLQGGSTIIAKYRPVIQVEITISKIDINLPNYVQVQILNSPNLLLVPAEQLNSVTQILEKEFRFEILT